MADSLIGSGLGSLFHGFVSSGWGRSSAFTAGLEDSAKPRPLPFQGLFYLVLGFLLRPGVGLLVGGFASGLGCEFFETDWARGNFHQTKTHVFLDLS